jgi:hypothetical protein
MKLASYKSTRPGFQGLGNTLIRFRLESPYSHSELIFMPGDGVDHLMPDGTCEPDENGAYWAASSVFAEKLPAHSPRRAGKTGGVRFKRIKFDPANWDIIDLDNGQANEMSIMAAIWFVKNQGAPYDMVLISKFVVWAIPFQNNDKVMCSEAVATALGMPEPARIDPAMLHALAKRYLVKQ